MSTISEYSHGMHETDIASLTQLYSGKNSVRSTSGGVKLGPIIAPLDLSFTGLNSSIKMNSNITSVSPNHANNIYSNTTNNNHNSSDSGHTTHSNSRNTSLHSSFSSTTEGSNKLSVKLDHSDKKVAPGDICSPLATVDNYFEELRRKLDLNSPSGTVVGAGRSVILPPLVTRPSYSRSSSSENTIYRRANSCALSSIYEVESPSSRSNNNSNINSNNNSNNNSNSVSNTNSSSEKIAEKCEQKFELPFGIMAEQNNQQLEDAD